MQSLALDYVHFSNEYWSHSTPTSLEYEEFDKQYKLILLIDSNERRRQNTMQQELFKYRQQFYSNRYNFNTQTHSDLDLIFSIETRQLNSGDYLWIAKDKINGEEFIFNAILERKTRDDLVKSKEDGRLYEQTHRMCHQNMIKNNYLLLEKYHYMPREEMKEVERLRQKYDRLRIIPTGCLQESSFILFTFTLYMKFHYKDFLLKDTFSQFQTAYKKKIHTVHFALACSMDVEVIQYLQTISISLLDLYLKLKEFDDDNNRLQWLFDCLKKAQEEQKQEQIHVKSITKDLCRTIIDFVITEDTTSFEGDAGSSQEETCSSSLHSLSHFSFSFDK